MLGGSQTLIRDPEDWTPVKHCQSSKAFLGEKLQAPHSKLPTEMGAQAYFTERGNWRFKFGLKQNNPQT